MLHRGKREKRTGKGSRGIPGCDGIQGSKKPSPIVRVQWLPQTVSRNGKETKGERKKEPRKGRGGGP